MARDWRGCLGCSDVNWAGNYCIKAKKRLPNPTKIPEWCPRPVDMRPIEPKPAKRAKKEVGK